MAKKKKRKRPPSPRPEAQQPTSGSVTTTAKRERKEAARERKQKEAKAAVRRGALRRAAIGGVVGLLVFFAFSYFINRAPKATPLSADATAAAVAGGARISSHRPPARPVACTSSPGRRTRTTSTRRRPAYHDPSPLPCQPRVYTTADLANYRETMAVHTLEHGSVIMYYRPTGDPGGLPQAGRRPTRTDRPEQQGVLPDPLPGPPDGTALAFTAWNKLLTCPAKITADQARTVAQGFIDSFACTNNAPEGKLGDGC